MSIDVAFTLAERLSTGQRSRLRGSFGSGVGLIEFRTQKVDHRNRQRVNRTVVVVELPDSGLSIKEIAATIADDGWTVIDTQQHGGVRR